MKISNKILWKVPLFCIIAGVIAFYTVVYLIGPFMLETLPDGTITSDDTRTLIGYGAIFIVTLMVGGMFVFREMTRKEIFFSASIVVVIGLLLNLLQWIFSLTTGIGAIFFMYASRIFEWSSIVTLLLFRVSDNISVIVFISSLTPYLFILFGKKEIVNSDSQSS